MFVSNADFSKNDFEVGSLFWDSFWKKILMLAIEIRLSEISAVKQEFDFFLCLFIWRLKKLSSADAAM